MQDNSHNRLFTRRILMLKRLIDLFTHTGILVIFIAAAGIQSATADDQSGKTLVGSWTVLVTSNLGLPPVTDLTTVNRDGTMTNSDAMFGTGHGVWKRVGKSQFEFKFMTPILLTASLVPPGSGFPPGSILTVTGTLAVDKGGATAFGPYEAVVEHPAIGPVMSFAGTVAFARISIDDTGD
jgi:hypothetical protein